MTTDNALIVIRTLVYADLLPLFGLALFGLYGFGKVRDALHYLPLRQWLLLLALGGLAFGVIHLAAMASAMAGTGLWPPNRRHMIMLLDMTGTGTAFIIRFVALTLVLPLVLALRTHPRSSLVSLLVCSAVSVSSLAWAGHGVMKSGGIVDIHLIGDIIHLLAAGGWIGALGAFLFMLFEPNVATDRMRIERLAGALRAFAGIGTLLVAAILVTGIINVISIIGWTHLSGLLGSPYGDLLAGKLALFVTMLGLASLNRFWLVPTLEKARQTGATQEALAALRFSIVIESGCALAILTLVGALGLLAPPH